MKIGVIGGGIAGLTAAFKLSQKDHQVVVFEKENYLGGLAAGFKKKDWSWHLEHFFHHLFTTDSAAKKLFTELGLKQKLFFQSPKTSIYLKGKISQFNSPLSLLNFPFFSWPQKIRTGLATGYLKTTNNWQALEKTIACHWLKKFYGQKVYQLLWEPLLAGKFGQQKDKISMAWFWARIKKRSTRLGYLEGGFQILIDKLAEAIKQSGGQIFLNHEVKNLKELRKNFDKVIITTPTEKFFKTKLPKMIGSLSLILELKEKFLTDNTYWLNINDANFPFVAVVEHTNLVSPKYYGGHHLAYVGGYYPQNHRYFKMNKNQILKEFLPYLKKINPNLSPITYHLSRNLYAQPIVPINYSQLIPSFKTPISGVLLANMQMVYPWDRGINYAIELGEKVADEVAKK